ncbi:DUF2079 domain-containing protein [candidate division WWE3 bacterium]|nr:DUF2079 domain-containing protein [candidate division WWE3 bacterium]
MKIFKSFKNKQFMQNITNKLPFLTVLLFSLIIFAVSVRISYSRYLNFENGKFDLGNMSQMVWNTMNGKFMYLTDYFGTNMPRWGMSHVDPLLIIFVPLMVIFKSPLVLVFGQLFLVIFSSLILYKIAYLELKHRWAAAFIAISYLLYPAIGYILAWTDFHGVTAAMPFFFAAFYLFEQMYQTNDFSKKKLILFWLCLILTMSGKEEIPLFVFMFGFFILFWRNNFAKLFEGLVSQADLPTYTTQLKQFFVTRNAKLAITMMVVSFVWFYYAFFILIPNSAHYRVNGYNKFVESIGVTPEETINVDSKNYFLLRYEEFGSGYTEIIFNVVTNPVKVMRAWVDGGKPTYFTQTFLPTLYLPLVYPPLFAMAIPELIINYTSTAGGVSTANIENHRISMIVVILFIALTYGVNFLAQFFKKYLKISEVFTVYLLAISLLVVNIIKTFEYSNPVYLWMQQAVSRRVVAIVKAEENLIKDDRAFSKKIKEGDRLKLVRLETKDRDCAGYIMKYIPDWASVTGPDYMGAKLSLRETYALFPALYKEADYIIADIYARKVSRILGIPSIVINSKVADIMIDPNYHPKFICGNLALFERQALLDNEIPKQVELPIQQVFNFTPKVDYLIDRGLFLRDYLMPDTFSRQEFYVADFVYERKESMSLDDYKLFLTFVDMNDNEYFQIPHLASYAMKPLKDFNFERFYVEKVNLMLPDFMNTGKYRVFLGLTNGIDTQSIYLKEVEVK